MTKFEDNMEEIFDIDVSEETKPAEIVKEEENVDATKDYEYTRGELYRLIEQGQEAVQGALEVAQESGHPRAFEVAVNAMKQVADMSDKLIDLQQKMKNLNKDEEKKGPSSVTNNAIFLGSTAELQKMLKRGKVEE
jgi:hypothetical protein|tara:strand:+ start:177 stop:584 length:408 start_codon:yes stop_codon:yes gene_type:complete